MSPVPWQWECKVAVAPLLLRWVKGSRSRARWVLVDVCMMEVVEVGQGYHCACHILADLFWDMTFFRLHFFWQELNHWTIPQSLLPILLQQFWLQLIHYQLYLSVKDKLWTCVWLITISMNIKLWENVLSPPHCNALCWGSGRSRTIMLSTMGVQLQYCDHFTTIRVIMVMAFYWYCLLNNIYSNATLDALWDIAFVWVPRGANFEIPHFTF